MTELARVAAATFSVPLAIVSVRLGEDFVLFGRHGSDAGDLCLDRMLGGFADAPLLIEDLFAAGEPRLAAIAAGGVLRFFASAPIFNERFQRIGLVCVADRHPRSPRKHLLATLQGVADIVAQILPRENANALAEPPTAAAAGGGAFRETSPVAGDGPTIAESFLLDTLVRRKSLISRNDLSYLAVRAWRKPVRKHQIAALRQAKQAPSAAFVETVAGEIADGLARLAGAAPVRLVTHVPCGHSRRDDCLSRRLARCLAGRMDLPFVAAFRPNFAAGSSHPKANLSRPAMEIDTQVVEPVLLVDDVASSGRHMEEAAGLLRQTSPVVLPVAWIAGCADIRKAG